LGAKDSEKSDTCRRIGLRPKTGGIDIVSERRANLQKILVVVILLLFAFIFAGCNGSKQVTSNKPIQKEKSVYTASEVLQALKKANLPIGKYEEYTAKTNTNKLLGRPNQYTGKINFEDTRIKEDDSDLSDSIEVFKNQSDLEARKAYTENISKNIAFLNQYIYAHKNILLRLDNALTPDQAKEYEKALSKL